MAILCALSAAGCHSAPFIWVHNLPKEAKASAADVADGRITAGDMVEVRVFGQDSLTTRGRVRPTTGTLTLPLVGAVTMAGKQPTDLAKELEERFRPYVNDPRVIVAVQESQIAVTAVGEVKQVGVLQLDPPATVLQALAQAGGMSEFADPSKIFVLRSTAGKSQRIRFTYDALVGGDAAAAAFLLKSGDVLIVE